LFFGCFFLFQRLAERSHISRKAVLAGSLRTRRRDRASVVTGTGSLIWLGVILFSPEPMQARRTRLEDVVAASCAPKEQHGMAFGRWPQVNALGEFCVEFAGWRAVECVQRGNGIRSLRRALSGGGQF